jgi:hypothetical protein
MQECHIICCCSSSTAHTELQSECNTVFRLFFGVSRLQERNRATQCHPSKVPTRERCNLTDTTPRGAAQPPPRRMAMWATPSALPSESRIQGPAYAPAKQHASFKPAPRSHAIRRRPAGRAAARPQHSQKRWTRPRGAFRNKASKLGETCSDSHPRPQPQA